MLRVWGKIRKIVLGLAAGLLGSMARGLKPTDGSWFSASPGDSVISEVLKMLRSDFSDVAILQSQTRAQR